jgi:hypothetical protein
MHRLARTFALTCLLPLVACENRAYRTDETMAAQSLVGRCFIIRAEFHVLPSKAWSDRDRKRSDKESTTASFDYDGHFGTWPGPSDYGLDVPAGSSFVVEKVLAIHYPYPKSVTYWVPYVRLDAKRNGLLVEASRLFIGLDQELPRPVPDFLTDCDE